MSNSRAPLMRLKKLTEIQASGVDLLYIATGCIVFVIGMNAMMMPHQFLSGGVAGVALLIHHLSPGMDTGWWYLLLNLPLVWLGWHFFGRRFMFLTLFGMIFFAMAAAWIKPPAMIVNDRFGASILAGVICGLGGGLILRSRGSAGGFDVLAIYFNRKLGLSVPNVGFALNAVPLAAGLLFHDLEIVIYSCLFYYVYSRVLKVVLVGPIRSVKKRRRKVKKDLHYYSF
jgi:uncharacterized membrane-anchored protein YitT (DUF2179 family)